MARVLDATHPKPELVNLIWRAIRSRNNGNLDQDFSYFRTTILFQTDTHKEYITKAPSARGIVWGELDRVDGMITDMPGGAYCGNFYIKMPKDFNKRLDTLEGYMNRKKLYPTDVPTAKFDIKL